MSGEGKEKKEITSASIWGLFTLESIHTNKESPTVENTTSKKNITTANLIEKERISVDQISEHIHHLCESSLL